MQGTTYTLLVTIVHDDGAAPSPELVEVMVQRGLEEGVRGMAGVPAAIADCLVGDKLPAQMKNTPVDKVKRCHAACRDV